MGMYGRADYDEGFDVPDDEPLFVIRARDAAAPEAVRCWARIAEELGAAPELVESARTHARAMERYQSDHGRKVPDL